LGGRDSSVEERRAIEAEAARLFLEARESGDPAAWDRAYEWVAQDPAHGVAFAKAEVSWELSERLKEIAPQLEPEAIAGPAGHFEALFSGRMVAALVAIAMVGTLGSIGLQKIAAVDRYRTAVGAEREIRLADGSIAHLNTDTAIEVSLRSDRRFIRLLRGEARFDVYLNRRAPFVVQANDATLRALGTDFNVRLRPEMTEVTVIEGGVAVRESERARAPGGRGGEPIPEGADPARQPRPFHFAGHRRLSGGSVGHLRPRIGAHARPSSDVQPRWHRHARAKRPMKRNRGGRDAARKR
jgi:transmembrane sensor